MCPMPHYIALHRPHISHFTLHSSPIRCITFLQLRYVSYVALSAFGSSQLPLWLLVGNQMPVPLKVPLWGKIKVVFRVKCTFWEALRYQWSVSLWCEGPEWSRSQPRATSPPVKTFLTTASVSKMSSISHPHFLGILKSLIDLLFHLSMSPRCLAAPTFSSSNATTRLQKIHQHGPLVANLTFTTHLEAFNFPSGAFSAKT